LTEIYKTQRFKSDFVANVSHELRTPLQSIKLGLETINEGHATNDFESQKKFLPIILKQTSRMENLVSDLLSLSKIELQEHIRPNNKVDLNDIISHVLEINSDLVKKRKMKIEYIVEGNDWVILGDRNRLIEVFTNLIDNACKYSEENSTIKISLTDKDKIFLFSIKDQGVGIPKKYLPRITERFFRVDPARSKEAGGTGLGLAIVKHIVNQHKARMEIFSEEGKGTEFIIEFPKS
jgi:two-component system phosphate regulon sensor histidine kinase PhoR